MSKIYLGYSEIHGVSYKKNPEGVPYQFVQFYYYDDIENTVSDGFNRSGVGKMGFEHTEYYPSMDALLMDVEIDGELKVGNEIEFYGVQSGGKYKTNRITCHPVKK